MNITRSYKQPIEMASGSTTFDIPKDEEEPEVFYPAMNRASRRTWIKANRKVLERRG